MSHGAQRLRVTHQGCRIFLSAHGEPHRLACEKLVHVMLRHRKRDACATLQELCQGHFF